ncbi:proteoglycan 4-like [Myxocyprinus asiaticus]|uniref:proteoglycan 4-like n=1 Tax=Myxocyprinus asiaticus TaxID=70543 RepID=UPI002222E837|nr:proteoglycan 4-like [Myxocyprinus asiaticus]
MTGSTLVSSLLALACVFLPLCAAQGSCRGRCGEPFARGQVCNCDYSCFSHGECCKDFEEVCTVSGSCRGRCDEPFRRGRQCDCDSDCVLYNTCCPDYHGPCDAFSNLKAPRSSKITKTTEYTDKCIAACLANQQDPDVLRDGNMALAGLNNLMALSEAPSLLTGGPIAQDTGLYLSSSDIPDIGTNPSGFPLPESGPGPASAVGSEQAGGPSSAKPLTIPVQVALAISGQGDPVQSSGPASGSGRPSNLADIAQSMGANNPSGLGPDLCSGLPIDGLAALFNGSIIVFRGHFFWLLNPKTRSAGPAQRITEVLGIPSPIDTAFTRCNCQSKTIIIKGDDYWSFENGVMEPGYPRSVSTDFGGLTGEISAALPIPATRKRPETVYFFKKGGRAHKFSYPPGSAPNCSGKRSKNTKNQHARQAGMQLSGEINLSLTWKGFPTPVTSALSMPNPRKSDGFDYLVFSWPKIFNIKISGELPTLAAPASSPSQQNDIRSWLNCP